MSEPTWTMLAVEAPHDKWEMTFKVPGEPRTYTVLVKDGPFLERRAAWIITRFVRNLHLDREPEDEHGA